MRSDWDRRAAEDHKLHIAAGHADGETFYLGKLSRGELSRSAFLRELLWSEEGRATRGPSPVAPCPAPR
ncbi:MAG: hypothetical protein ACHQM4_04510 [Thermoanaerobaculia bacterium]